MKRWEPYAYPGPDGTHRNAAPGLNQRGSWPDANGYQQVLDELSNLVLDAGLEPSATPNGHQVTEAIRSGRLQYCVADGTANALTVTPDPVYTSYSSPMMLLIKIVSTNTAAATIKANDLAPKPIVRADGLATQKGDLVSGSIVQLFYDHANDCFQISGLYTSNLPASDMQVFLATTPFTVPAGIFRLKRIRVWGSGARGGETTGANSAGGGGGGGGYAEAINVPVTPGSTILVTVGVGGNNTTPNGGTTSVGSIVSATGGTVGGDGINAPSLTAGMGGEGIGGAFRVNGQSGGSPVVLGGGAGNISGTGGAAGLGGGSSQYGSGASAGNGLPGVFPGGGGNGGLWGGGGGFGAGGLATIEY